MDVKACSVYIPVSQPICCNRCFLVVDPPSPNHSYMYTLYMYERIREGWVRLGIKSESNCFFCYLVRLNIQMCD